MTVYRNLILCGAGPGDSVLRVGMLGACLHHAYNTLTVTYVCGIHGCRVLEMRGVLRMFDGSQARNHCATAHGDCVIEYRTQVTHGDCVIKYRTQVSCTTETRNNPGSYVNMN